MGSIMNLVAWAGLPFAVRDLVRVGAMLVTRHLIEYPGLSGFANPETGAAGLFLGEVLRLVDLYLVWHIVLQVIGLRSNNDPGPAKAWGAVLITQAIALALQAFTAYLAAQMSNLTIIRPFLF